MRTGYYIITLLAHKDETFYIDSFITPANVHSEEEARDFAMEIAEVRWSHIEGVELVTVQVKQLGEAQL